MKTNYLLLLIVLLVAAVFVSGCTSSVNNQNKENAQQQLQQVTCNKPYILVGTSCCLDQNDNSICDTDEIPKCNPNWKCSTWSDCTRAGIQTRTCTDENNCDVNTNKPTESQTCTLPQQETMLNKSTVLVSTVIDGDSIELQNNIEVRLLGINTPERGQPYYLEATNRLKELVEGKNVVLESDVQEKDQYDRLLRYVSVDDLFVNLQLVKEGYATVYILQPNTKYETSLRNAENEAKTLKLNIWKQPTDENICDNRCIGISYFKWNAEGNDCNNLNDEYLTFVNTCSYFCDLTSWTVKDESSRNPYAFPTFALESGKTVTLYTGCGTDTKTQLYWCSSGYSCNAIWNNDGDTLYLRNLKGELVLNYPYAGFS